MTSTTPPPAEWAPHAAVWIGFPSHAELWQEDLEQAREEVVAFAAAVHAEGRGETVILVAADGEAADAARALAPFAEVVVQPFGDIWLRDTGPILLGDGSARLFGFNGWGGKYDLPGDDTVGERLAEDRGLSATRCDWILEGGAPRLATRLMSLMSLSREMAGPRAASGRDDGGSVPAIKVLGTVGHIDRRSITEQPLGFAHVRVGLKHVGRGLGLVVKIRARPGELFDARDEVCEQGG